MTLNSIYVAHVADALQVKCGLDYDDAASMSAILLTEYPLLVIAAEKFTNYTMEKDEFESNVIEAFMTYNNLPELPA